MTVFSFLQLKRFVFNVLCYYLMCISLHIDARTRIVATSNRSEGYDKRLCVVVDFFHSCLISAVSDRDK